MQRASRLSSSGPVVLICERSSQFASVSADPDDIEARCLLAFSAVIGHHFIAADHGARNRADVLDPATRRLLA